MVKVGFLLIHNYCAQSKYASETLNCEKLFDNLVVVFQHRESFSISDIILYLCGIFDHIKPTEVSDRALNHIEKLVDEIVEDLLDTSDSKSIWELISLLTTICANDGSLLEVALRNQELYSYLVDPRQNREYFSSKELATGELFARWQFIAFISAMNDNSHLMKLISFGLLELIDTVINVNESKLEETKEINEVVIEALFVLWNVLLSCKEAANKVGLII